MRADEIVRLCVVFCLISGTHTLLCYWCSGVGQDRDCEQHPYDVRTGPIYIDCPSRFCITAKVTDAQSGEVQSFARLCDNIPRGNQCVRDSRLVTCYESCSEDLCNRGNPSADYLNTVNYANNGKNGRRKGHLDDTNEKKGSHHNLVRAFQQLDSSQGFAEAANRQDENGDGQLISTKRSSDNSDKQQISSERGTDNSDGQQIYTERSIDSNDRQQISSGRSIDNSDKQQIATERGIDSSDGQQISTGRSIDNSVKQQIATERGIDISDGQQISTVRSIRNSDRQQTSAERSVDNRDGQQISVERRIENGGGQPIPAERGVHQLLVGEQSTTSTQQSTTSAQQSTTSAQLSTTSTQQSTTSAQQSTTSTQQSTTSAQQSTIPGEIHDSAEVDGDSLETDVHKTGRATHTKANPHTAYKGQTEVQSTDNAGTHQHHGLQIKNGSRKPAEVSQSFSKSVPASDTNSVRKMEARTETYALKLAKDSANEAMLNFPHGRATRDNAVDDDEDENGMIMNRHPSYYVSQLKKTKSQNGRSMLKSDESPHLVSSSSSARQGPRSLPLSASVSNLEGMNTVTNGANSRQISSFTSSGMGTRKWDASGNLLQTTSERSSDAFTHTAGARAHSPRHDSSGQSSVPRSPFVPVQQRYHDLADPRSSRFVIPVTPLSRRHPALNPDVPRTSAYMYPKPVQNLPGMRADIESRRNLGDSATQFYPRQTFRARQSVHTGARAVSDGPVPVDVTSSHFARPVPFSALSIDLDQVPLEHGPTSNHIAMAATEGNGDSFPSELKKRVLEEWNPIRGEDLGHRLTGMADDVDMQRILSAYSHDAAFVETGYTRDSIDSLVSAFRQHPGNRGLATDALPTETQSPGHSRQREDTSTRFNHAKANLASTATSRSHVHTKHATYSQRRPATTSNKNDMFKYSNKNDMSKDWSARYSSASKRPQRGMNAQPTTAAHRSNQDSSIVITDLPLVDRGQLSRTAEAHTESGQAVKGGVQKHAGFSGRRKQVKSTFKDNLREDTKRNDVSEAVTTSSSLLQADKINTSSGASAVVTSSKYVTTNSTTATMPIQVPSDSSSLQDYKGMLSRPSQVSNISKETAETGDIETLPESSSSFSSSISPSSSTLTSGTGSQTAEQTAILSRNVEATQNNQVTASSLSARRTSLSFHRKAKTQTGPQIPSAVTTTSTGPLKSAASALQASGTSAGATGGQRATAATASSHGSRGNNLNSATHLSNVDIGNDFGSSYAPDGKHSKESRELQSYGETRKTIESPSVSTQEDSNTKTVSSSETPVFVLAGIENASLSRSPDQLSTQATYKLVTSTPSSSSLPAFPSPLLSVPFTPPQPNSRNTTTAPPTTPSPSTTSLQTSSNTYQREREASSTSEADTEGGRAMTRLGHVHSKDKESEESRAPSRGHRLLVSTFTWLWSAWALVCWSPLLRW